MAGLEGILSIAQQLAPMLRGAGKQDYNWMMQGHQKEFPVGGTSSRKRKRLNAPASKGYVQRVVAKTREARYDETGLTSTEAAYDSPIMEDLTTPAQGDGITQRSGEKIKPISVEYRFRVVNAETTNQVFRAIIFQWKQDDVPTLTQVITADGSAATSSTVYKSYNREENTSYRILYDSGPLLLGGSAQEALSTEMIIAGKAKPKSGITPVNFIGSGVTGTGKIYFLAFSDAADAADSITVAGNFMLNFYDKV